MFNIIKTQSLPVHHRAQIVGQQGMCSFVTKMAIDVVITNILFVYKPSFVKRWQHEQKEKINKVNTTDYNIAPSWCITSWQNYNIFHKSNSLCCRQAPEHVSGAENGVERPENRVERSGNGAWSGLNWPLTARSDVIFHWFHIFIIT